MPVILNGGVPNVTTSGEVWITETERENDVWVQYQVTLAAADSYHLFISKDNAAWPHKIQNQSGSRIDITSLYYGATLAINADGILQIGVINRIDGTNADIKYFIGVPFFTGAAKVTIVQSLRGVPSQVKTDTNGSAVLKHGLTNMVETNVAAVNTATALPSPAGNVAPGLGDIILKYDYTASAVDLALFAFYHNND